MPSIALLLGSFHKPEIEQMAVQARSSAAELGLTIVEEVWVPGAYEKPLALKRLLARKDIDGVAVLGIIERGETKNGLVMGQVVLAAMVNLELEFMKPIGIGILGPEILPEQIAPRLDVFATKAVRAVAQMLNA